MSNIDNLVDLEWDRYFSKDHYIKQLAIEWAGTMITITQEDEDIIFACKESVLLNDKSLSLLAQGLLSLRRTESLQATMMSSSSCVMVIMVPAHSIAC